MRFFSGNRSGNGSKKQSAASMLFKKKMGAESGQTEAFDKRLKREINDSLENYSKTQQKLAERRGEKNTGTPEISKNAKMMLEVLARKKVMKEIKKEKAAVAAVRAEEARKKQAAMVAKNQALYQEDMKKKQYLADQEAAAKPSSSRWNYFGPEEPQ